MDATETFGAWVDESMGEHPLFMVRRCDDVEQAVFHPRGTDGEPDVNRFVLSQVHLANIFSSRQHQEFATFRDAMEEAEKWRKKRAPTRNVAEAGNDDGRTFFRVEKHEPDGGDMSPPVFRPPTGGNLNVC